MRRSVAEPIGRADKYFALAGGVIRSGTRVLIGLAVARLAGLDDFASFVLLVAGETIAATLLNASIVTPMITVAACESGDRRDAALRLGLRRNTRAALAAGLLALLLIPVMARWSIGPVAGVGFAVAVVTSNLANARRGVLSTLFRTNVALQGDLLWAFTALAGLAACAALDGGGAAVVATAWWSMGLGSVAATWRMRRGAVLSSRASLDAGLRDRTNSAARGMAVGSVAYTLSSRLQPFVLELVRGAAQVGLFGAASTFAGPIRLLSMSLSGVIRPRLSLHRGHGDATSFRHTMFAAGAAIVVPGVLLVVVAWVAGEAIGIAVFGPRFTGVGILLPIAMGYALLEAVGATLTVAMQSATDRGAAITARARILVAAGSLAVIWPACVAGGAAGALLAMAGGEAVFVLILACGVHRAVRAMAADDVAATGLDERRGGSWHAADLDARRTVDGAPGVHRPAAVRRAS